MKKFEISVEEVEEQSIDCMLQENEEILWQGKPYKKAFVLEPFIRFMPIALFWLLIDLTFIVCMFVFKDEMGIGNAIYFIIPFFAIHLAPVWIWIGSLIKGNLEHKNVEYAVTNRRIIIKKGIIGIDFISLFYTDVESVDVKVSVLDKIFQVGDLYVVANKTKAAISDIKNPYTVYKLIQKVSLDMRTDIEYPNALRPNANLGYKTNYNLDAEEIEDKKNN